MTTTNHTTAPVGDSWLHGLRSAISERRQARAARRSLAAELASYRTPAELEDLFAALRRAEDEPTAEEMRHLLFSRLLTSQHHRIAA